MHEKLDKIIERVENMDIRLQILEKRDGKRKVDIWVDDNDGGGGDHGHVDSPADILGESCH